MPSFGIKILCNTQCSLFCINHLSSLLSDELGNLANGNGLTLVAEGESTQGGVFGKALDTDASAVVAGDLQAGDDAHALCGETGCLL